MGLMELHLYDDEGYPLTINGGRWSVELDAVFLRKDRKPAYAELEGSATAGRFA